MNSFASLIDALGSQTEIASALGVRVQAVSNMKARNSIAPAHWHGLVELALRKGVQGVSVDQMSRWYAAAAQPAREVA